MGKRRQITPDMAGTWLDGSQGWHNTYRAVERAREWGWKPSYGFASPKGLAHYRRTITRACKFYAAGDTGAIFRTKHEEMTYDDVAEWFIGQGGLCDQATEYLDSIAPEGYVFDWDAGELSLSAIDDLD